MRTTSFSPLRPRTIGCALLVLIAALPSQGAQSATTLDSGFSPVIARVGGVGSAVAVQTDGKIILAGGFNAVNGIARNGLVRLNVDGTVDPTFVARAVCCGFAGGAGSATVPPISAVAVQSDGKIILGGGFTNVSGTARSGLARLNADGTIDLSFDPGTGLAGPSVSGALLPVVSILIQSDAKILVGGYFTAINGVARSGVARLNADGSVDRTFDPGTALSIGFPDFGPLAGMALLKNGQIMVAGAFQAFGDVKQNGIARLNANGSIDASFAPALYLTEGNPTLDGIVVQPDGGIVLSGSFNVFDAQFRSGLARLKPDGSTDVSFDAGLDGSGVETYQVLTLQSDGKFIVLHLFTDAQGNSHRALARLNANGTVDPTFNLELAPDDGGRFQLRSVALQTDGRVLAAGSLSSPTDPSHRGVIRTDAAGGLDAAFKTELELGEGADSNVRAVALQTDGRMLIGGSFDRVNGVARRYLARLNVDGSVDASFSPTLEMDGTGGYVSAIVIEPDGKIAVAGLFSSVNQAKQNGIARLNADGTADTSFQIGSGTKEGDPAGDGAVGAVTALALQPDGKLLVAGGFASFNGQAIPGLGRLNSDGTLDQTFSSGVGVCFTCDPPDIRGLGVLPSGLIMVRGLFNRVESFVINGVTRLQTNGAVDLALKSPVQTEEEVSAMAVGPDGRTVVAITFNDPVSTSARTRFVRFNLDGAIDTTFNPGLAAADNSIPVPVSSIVLDPAGQLLAGGRFTHIADTARNSLARLKPDGTVDAEFDAGSGFGSGVFPTAHTSDPLVACLAVQTDGSILVGGNFAIANNQVRLGLARFLGNPGPVLTGTAATLSGLARSATGSVSLLVLGEPGRNYRIESSTDLRTWTTAGSATGAALARLFTDPNPTPSPQRFYRAVSQ